MDYRRLFELFSYQEFRFPQKVALAQKKGLKWDAYSTKECIAQINRVSAGLLELGLKKGDKAAIYAHIGSPKWNFLDLGMQQIGLVVVPIHSTVSEEHLLHILTEADIQLCVASKRELFQKADRVRPQAPELKHLFTMEQLPDLPGWQDLILEPTDKHFESFQTIRAGIHEDDLATIIYTSGTTGIPKGVMLSHKNLISNIKSTIALVPVNCDKRVLSYLPLSHVFERMVTYAYMAVGASVYYPQENRALPEQLRAVRPHYFTTVPKSLEDIYGYISNKSRKRGLWWRPLNKWAVSVGEKYNDRVRMSFLYWLKLLVANLLVFGYWRRLLGGKVEGIICGAAALPVKIGKVFSAAGVEIREGYGLTETSPVIAMNRFEPGGYRFGTVGIPIPGVEVKIDQINGEEEGEVLVKGPNVMLGYFKQEKATQEAFDEEGWLKTGDLGKWVHKRFLKITGRKKDLFKTTSGRYIAPEPLENVLKNSDFVNDAIVAGANKPMVVAILYPDFKELKDWCEMNRVHWTSPQFMVYNPRVQKLFQQELDGINEKLPHYMQIKKFLLIYKPWSIESGELTPTFKPIREKIKQQYAKELEKLYLKP
jgi:long-chain acyl-CoA synthetase